MKKKIKLKNILESNVPKDCKFLLNELDSIILNSMLEACRQVLELAAENGEVVYNSDTLGSISLSTTEKKKFVLDKNSILNTIAQVEL